MKQTPTHVPNAVARILVVDDLPELRRTVARVLHSCGCAVVEVSNGLDALDALDAHAFDLVLSDIAMPGMNGFELLYEIRRRAPSLPVVLMSAETRDDIASEATARGAVAYLAKPFRIRSLETTIAEALGGYLPFSSPAADLPVRIADSAS